MRIISILAFLTLVGCSEADIEPCSQVEIGMFESELIKELGSPFQKSDEIDNKKALMFKGENIPTIMIVELNKTELGKYKVSHCNVM
ncbi:hypothetical protein JAO78_016520 [Alishewanella sp. 16-MA]|uniref:Lipoprotein n=1 Tax=Alishewanella maricola TaxID=2795740 RepID=A0ABS8C7T7_9ALTE|nr:MULTISPECIES: hypothetical protein [Alishewanella]MCB5228408.1 hypothetical protein [Alishewanella maricola]MDP5460934.1 hypothetical protein [Alishewanella sp. SMS8]